MQRAAPCLSLPPRNFRPAGEVLFAEFSPSPPPFIEDTEIRGVRGRRADGVRYEIKGQEWLVSAREHSYVQSPWFRFAPAGDDARRAARATSCSWCQPDGLDIDIRKGLILIVEFKLQHTANAWWQTRKLYEPVVRAAFGSELWSFAIVEIVKWYDPDVAFPEHFTFIPDLGAAEPGGFHVHNWNGRR